MASFEMREPEVLSRQDKVESIAGWEISFVFGTPYVHACVREIEISDKLR